MAGLQELGVGLSLGALLDATVVRGLLMPSVMALIGPLQLVAAAIGGPAASRGGLASHYR